MFLEYHVIFVVKLINLVSTVLCGVSMTRVICVRLSREIIDLLEKLRGSRSISEVVRDAIMDYVKRYGGSKGCGSVLGTEICVGHRVCVDMRSSGKICGGVVGVSAYGIVVDTGKGRTAVNLRYVRSIEIFR